MPSGAVQRCPVCEHPSVLGINQAILNGKSFRSIAEHYRIGSERSGTFRPDHKKVSRHAERCLATSFQQIQKDSLEAQGAAMMARLKYLDEQVDTAITDALRGEIVMVGDAPMLDDDGNPVERRSISHVRALLAAVREGRHNVALVAKLAGALPDEDADALERARKGLEDPEVRKLMQKVEELLADKERRDGHDRIES